MEQNLDADFPDAAGAAGISAAGQRLLLRLRHVALPCLWWAVIGSVAGAAWSLPQLMPVLEKYGYAVWLYRALVPGFLIALILILSLAVGIGSGTVTQTGQRLGRLSLILVVGAALGALVTWAIDLSVPIENGFPLPGRLMNWWLTNIVFGGAFGFAAVLNIRRKEENMRLAALLGRRSLLARQVAQSKLLKVRAQIDPEMVARILKNLRSQYQSRPDAAATLLDQLIAYLRLAMSREREGNLSAATELELVRAYSALCQAQTGLAIDLQIKVAQSLQQTPPVLPIFSIAKHLLDEAAGVSSRPLTLRIDVAEHSAGIALEVGTSALPGAAIDRLRAHLRELPGGGFDILPQLQNSGVHCYVVQAAGA